MTTIHPLAPRFCRRLLLSGRGSLAALLLPLLLPLLAVSGLLLNPVLAPQAQAQTGQVSWDDQAGSWASGTAGLYLREAPDGTYNNRSALFEAFFSLSVDRNSYEFSAEVRKPDGTRVRDISCATEATCGASELVYGTWAVGRHNTVTSGTGFGGTTEATTAVTFQPNQTAINGMAVGEVAEIYLRYVLANSHLATLRVTIRHDFDGTLSFSVTAAQATVIEGSDAPRTDLTDMPITVTASAVPTIDLSISFVNNRLNQFNVGNRGGTRTPVRVADWNNNPVLLRSFERILDDDVDEADGTLTFNFQEVNNNWGIVAGHTIVINIKDDDSPQITIARDVSVHESRGELVFSITMVPWARHATATTIQTVTVDYATAAGTATAGADYTDISGTLTFAPMSTSQQLTVDLNSHDVAEEPDESFTLTLSNPFNALPGSKLSATGTIRDLPELDISTGTGPEGGEVVFAVALTHGTLTTAVTVTYSTSEGSCTGPEAIVATPDADFVSVTGGTLVLSPGQTSASIAVQTIEDNIDETGASTGDPAQAECFGLQTAITNNARLRNAELVPGLITDNDEAPFLRVDPATGSERSGEVLFRVRLVNADDTAVARANKVVNFSWGATPTSNPPGLARPG